MDFFKPFCVYMNECHEANHLNVCKTLSIMGFDYVVTILIFWFLYKTQKS